MEEYILLKKSETEQNPFANSGLSEEQIGEITQSEKILTLIVGQYMSNIRLGAYALSVTPEDYAKLQIVERAMDELLNFVHSLPEAKREYERQKVIKEAEDSIKKKLKGKVK